MSEDEYYIAVMMDVKSEEAVCYYAGTVSTSLATEALYSVMAACLDDCSSTGSSSSAYTYDATVEAETTRYAYCEASYEAPT